MLQPLVWSSEPWLLFICLCRQPLRTRPLSDLDDFGDLSTSLVMIPMSLLFAPSWCPLLGLKLLYSVQVTSDDCTSHHPLSALQWLAEATQRPVHRARQQVVDYYYCFTCKL
jgi:hypothetical protein